MKYDFKNSPLIIGLALSAVVVGVRLYFISIGATHVDDALITYRYAENIASGYGYVYNIGERVLGTTNPLYTLILASLNLLGVSVYWASAILGLVSSGLTGLVLYLFGLKLKLGKMSAVAPILYAIWPNAINSDISGLETPLFTLATIAFFYFVLTARYPLAILLAGLGTMLRPEGIFLIGLYVLFRLVTDRNNLWKEISICAVIILPWVIFAWMYFGSPIPNSIPAKLALYLWSDTGSFWERLVRLWNLNDIAGWITVAGALGGLIYTLIRVYWGWLEALFVLALTFVLASAHTNLFFWYKSPLNPLWVLFLGAGLAGLVRIGLILTNRAFVVKGIVAGIVIAISLQIYPKLSQIAFYQKIQTQIYLDQHIAAGKYLANNAACDDVVIAEDIGYLGYHFRGRIIDRDGLVSPEVIEYNRKREYARFIRDQLLENPGHWLFISNLTPSTGEITKSGILDRHYELLRRFDFAGNDSYLLYRAKVEINLPDSAADKTG
ncbi:MAG: hypothetical protein IIB00_00880 [candidate division Zixibacteria bacterium]|nr:hypothetical protein [candidate division Zixibacteria bacterium]